RPRRGRRRADPRLHEVLPRAARPVAVAADPARPARADPRAAVGAVLGLRLLLLGAADGRAALGRRGAPAGPPGADRPAGDRSAAGPHASAPSAGRAAAAGDRGRGAVGARAPGGGRVVGGGPAAVGVVDPHARVA